MKEQPPPLPPLPHSFELHCTANSGWSSGLEPPLVPLPTPFGEMSHVFQAFLRRCNNQHHHQRVTSHQNLPGRRKQPSSNPTLYSSSSTHQTAVAATSEDGTGGGPHRNEEEGGGVTTAANDDDMPRIMTREKIAATMTNGFVDSGGRTSDGDENHHHPRPLSSSMASEESDDPGCREPRAATASVSFAVCGTGDSPPAEEEVEEGAGTANNNKAEGNEDMMNTELRPWPALPLPHSRLPTEGAPLPGPDPNEPFDDDNAPQDRGTKLGSMWACSTCTLENDARRRRCAACNGRRPIEFQTPPNRKRTSQARHNNNGSVGDSSSSTESSVPPPSPSKVAVVVAPTRKSQRAPPLTTRSSKRRRTAHPRPPPDDDATVTSVATAEGNGLDLAPPTFRISTSPSPLAVAARRAATTTITAASPIPPPPLAKPTPFGAENNALLFAAVSATPMSSTGLGFGLVERYELEDRLLRGRIRRAHQQVVAGEALIDNLQRQCREAQDRYEIDRQELTLAQKQWQEFQRDYGAVRAAAVQSKNVPGDGGGGVGVEGETPHRTPLPTGGPRSVESPSPNLFVSGGAPADPPVVVPPTLQQLNEVASKLAAGGATEPASRPSPIIDSQATIDPDLEGAPGEALLLGRQALPAPAPSPPVGRPGLVAPKRLDSSSTSSKPPPLSVSTNRRTAIDATQVETVPVRALGAALPGWDSTKPSRDFVAPRRLPSSSTTNAPTSKPHAQASAAATGHWIQAAKGARKEHRARQQQAPTRSLSHDGGGTASDQPSSSSSSAQLPPSPDHPYHEVVRGRLQRDHLPRHDCYCCRDFYAALDPTDALALLSHSRHRAQHSPSETPQDFWVVDFVDELEREAELERGIKDAAGPAAGPVRTVAAAAERER